LVFSGALAGCGGGEQVETGTQAKTDPDTQKQVNAMTDFYKKNPPNKSPKK